jgi:phospholipid/cholesterol/gamma-HCH transport system substrate-binding protein
METRANHLWVGVVTLALLAMLAAAVVWLAGSAERNRQEYDIFFEQSVEGLANGSQVTYAGVPVGEVEEIALWPAARDIVRVRIAIKEGTPVYTDTRASIRSSLTGVATIQLDRAEDRSGRPASTQLLVKEGRAGKPEIEPKQGGLGAILASAPDVLENINNVTLQLEKFLSDQNQARVMRLVDNTGRLTGNLADTTPQVRATMLQLQGTLREAEGSLAEFERVLASTDDLLNEEGASLAQELRKTLGSAQGAADSLSATLDNANPAVARLNNETLPATEAMIRDLRETSQSLRAVTEKIDREGAGGLVGGQKLPDYEP